MGGAGWFAAHPGGSRRPDPAVNGPAAPPLRARRTAATAVLLVAAAYLVAQLLVGGIHRAPSWDEAVYLSQVTPGTPALPFAPSRARGITLLVAPVMLTGGSVTVVRAFLTVASAIALCASFLLWISPVDPATAASGAAIFGFTWVALFYGSEVMPNLWSALLAVAATGAFVRALDGHERRWAVLAGGLAFLQTLMRPPDGLVLVLALAAFVLVARRSRLRALFPLSCGVVLGWAAWLGEMSARFGGPGSAIRQAGRLGHLTASGIADRVLQNLSLTDGPTIGPEPHAHVPAAGAVWWAAIVILVGVAVIRARSDGRSAPMSCATIVGLALAVEYLAFVAGLAPRFLLPAYAVLSIPTAGGVVSLVRSGAGRRGFGWSAVVVLIALGIWQAGTAGRIARDAATSRSAFRDVGLAVRRMAHGRPCFVGSDGAFPEVAFAAGCGGRELHASDASALADLESAAGGAQVYAVLRSPPDAGSPLLALPPTTITTSDGSTWMLYALPHHPV
jgi:hypothetical protein